MGKGVYFTTDYEFAKKWSSRRSNESVVYEADVDLSDLNVVCFDEHNKDDFYYLLYLCRIELEDVAQQTISKFDGADVVVGGILSGDETFVCELSNNFNNGDIDEQEFFSKMQNLLKRSQIQYCFKTEKALEIINRCFRIHAKEQIAIK